MNSIRKDQYNYLRKLTWRKVYNGFLVWISFYTSRWFGYRRHSAMPVSLSIEPTTACNLGCPECPSGLRQFTRPTGNLRQPEFENWIEQLHPFLTYINFYFQGEPFINPQLLSMVSLASQKGIYTATSTNAHFLDDHTAKQTVLSGLDRLIVSIDGTSQEVYEQYRVHGELQKVIEGTKRILHWKKELNSATPHLIFQFLVVAPNEHQIPEVLALANELGVDEVRLKTAQVYDYKNGNKLIPVNEKYSRYKRLKDGTYRIKNTLDNHCWRMWSSAVITWNGSVVPCCFDKDAQYKLGNLSKHSFNEIWNSTSYHDFRKKLLQSRATIDICANCSEGTKVWSEVD